MSVFVRQPRILWCMVGLAAATLPVGCRVLFPAPPFQYLSARIVVGAADCHQLLGLHYCIRNLSDKDFASLGASFSLYDSAGKPVPRAGSNFFDLSYEEVIPAGSTWAICTSLDSSFYFRPDLSLVAERFRIHRVDFTDDRSWSDPLELYAFPYEVTSTDESSGELQ